MNVKGELNEPVTICQFTSDNGLIPNLFRYLPYE